MARSFEELVAWQLANELKRRIYALTNSGPVVRDESFVRQIRRSAASAPSNIAEGFGRYYPKEFMQFLRVANGSLHETANHLGDGVDQGYFQKSEGDELRHLARRASIAATRLIKYLQTVNPKDL
jgi:four helix bundle protein